MPAWTTYARRKINVTLRLGDNAAQAGASGVGGSGSNSIKLEGLRVRADISKVVMPSSAAASIRIYGLTLDHINQFTTAGLMWSANQGNLVLVEAGDDANGMFVVFNGIINEAYPDFTQMPDSAFVIMAHTGTGIQLTPVTPTSVQGSTDAGTVFETIAKKAGVPLENSGVNAKLLSPYFPGSAWNQAILCGKAADCFVTYDDLKNVMAVWKKNGSRNSGGRVVISAENGMIGYPMFQKATVIFRTLFDPEIRGVGDKIFAETQFPAANGAWVVGQLDYSLSSETPNGPWEMLVSTYFPDLAT